MEEFKASDQCKNRIDDSVVTLFDGGYFKRTGGKEWGVLGVNFEVGSSNIKGKILPTHTSIAR